MAIDAAQLVLDQLDPILELDPTISASVTRQVEAQIARKGWSGQVLTDQQTVYVSLYALDAMIPRLLLKFAQEIRKAEGGRAKVEFHHAEDFLTELREKIKEDLSRGIDGTVASEIPDPSYRWPGTGVVGF